MDLNGRLERLWDVLETSEGVIDYARISPRITKLQTELVDVEREKAVLMQAARSQQVEPRIDAKEVLGYLEELDGVLAKGSVEERRTVLKGFVKEIVKGDREATVYYTLPMPPGRVSVGARGSSELGLVGGAEGTKDRTFCDSFRLALARRRNRPAAR